VQGQLSECELAKQKVRDCDRNALIALAIGCDRQVNPLLVQQSVRCGPSSEGEPPKVQFLSTPGFRMLLFREPVARYTLNDSPQSFRNSDLVTYEDYSARLPTIRMKFSLDRFAVAPEN